MLRKEAPSNVVEAAMNQTSHCPSGVATVVLGVLILNKTARPSASSNCGPRQRISDYPRRSTYSGQMTHEPPSLRYSTNSDISQKVEH